MKQSSKILLAAATVWPFLYMLLFFGFIMLTFLTATNNPGGGGPVVLFAVIFPLHILTMLLIMALTVFYIVNVFRNDRVVKDMKVLWAVVLFMGSIIAMPIYWYLYIWREPATPASPSQLNPGSDAQSWSAGQPAEGAYVPPKQAPDWR
ncbi:MAG TPA: hypothetical protein VN643_02520 [Pyrinomonadaceae bacterium]|nr:hypothetical protein [Pyrinomonadaceae bacterium]